jgi:hypothetical protein
MPGERKANSPCVRRVTGKTHPSLGIGGEWVFGEVEDAPAIQVFGQRK